MKKFIKIILGIFLVIVILFLIMWGFHGFPTKEMSDNSIYEPPQNSSSVIEINEDGKTTLKSIDTKTVLSQKNKPLLVDSEYIKYIDIASSDLPDEIKKELLEKSNNLRLHGSFSKGQITHEFKNTNYYKDRLDEIGGYESLEKKLNFEPTKIDEIFSDSKLIGGDYSGSYTEGKGYNSIFRAYESANSSIELNEIALSKSSNKVDFFKENINTYINNSPATIEKVDNGNIYNISWISGNRLFSMSTKNLSEASAIQKAQHIDVSVQNK